ncbi:MAG: zinc-binding dehydrogenase [Dehalococcoidia bacterium]|nr:zinc-binding dehydrogenase [Dehalococcoidia bacterium]
MSEKMLAARARGVRDIRCEEIDAPVPESGKVLVETRLASICGSDLHVVFMGYTGYTSGFPLPHGHPGHEGLGEVIEGGGTGFEPGERVLTVPSISISKTFAGYQLLDPRYLARLPQGMPESHLLMAQQLATVVFSCERLPDVAGATVAVIGQGSAGLFHNFMLSRMGAERIIAIEPVKARRDLSLSFGGDVTVDVTADKATEAVLDLTSGVGADLVVEAVGSVETLNQAMSMAKTWGRVQAFGLPSSMDLVPFDWNAFFRRRLTLNSTFGSQDEPGLPAVHRALDYIAGGEIDMEPIVTHSLPISQIDEAFELAHSREEGVIKVSLTF